MRRLIALGHKRAEFHTIDITYATSDPEWHPQSPPQPDEPDYDLIRKIELESREDEL